MTSKPKLASNPEYSAAVMASAGSGKTWTLVTRMLRLLLQGAEPGSLLAITFTVKAAAEMKQRLLERLEQWSFCSETELDGFLGEINHPITPQSRQQARKLFEQQLQAKTPTRALTFHAFFQELLSQFPHAADIPSGFELIESTFDHQELAWQQLLSEVNQQQDSELTGQLMVLLDLLGSNATRTALDNFLVQRSDWWAWTEKYQYAEEKLEFAQQELFERLKPELDIDLYADFFSKEIVEKLRMYADFFIQEINSDKNNAQADAVNRVLTTLSRSKSINLEPFFNEIIAIALTQKGEPRKVSTSQKAIKAYGDDRFTEASEAMAIVVEKIADTREKINCATNYQLNHAWYTVGQHYLKLFQQQKTQRRQLDFSDLEWKAYQLMNSEDEFSQLLKMLDDKIEHLLVDEFQDTNPTQWRFLLPLLHNFSASIERKNNLFIVGDSKQSIYGFRRANPKLLSEASSWVKAQLDGEVFSEDKSWRSAPEIMQVVNRVFSEAGYAAEIQSYSEHSTHQNELWGRVEIWPEFTKDAVDKETLPEGFRNPLLRPRATTDNAFRKESIAIAELIKKLVDNGLEICGTNGEKRALRYSDIQILVRKRTHVGDIERELQARLIPFKGSTRGTFMDRLEIKDLCALLRVLATPGDNLSLAQTLRSPLFSFSSRELILIAKTEGDNWYLKLLTLAANTKSEAFSNAVEQLETWQGLAAKLPLHDLITHIYFQGNVIERYLTAFPTWQSAQLQANLQRFVELALETNSGRYPGIHHFLARLELQAGKSSQDSLDEPIPGAANDAVDILTVHQAKGLEAPVVFVANCNDQPANSTKLNCIVDWKPERQRPDLIALLPKKDNLDQQLAELHQMQLAKERQEAANILYVALTRAKQLLIISGSAPRSATNNSSGEVKKTLKIPEMSKLHDLFEEQKTEDGRIIIQSTEPVFLHQSEDTDFTSLEPLPIALEQSIKLSEHDAEIAPSFNQQEPEGNATSTRDGQLRGNIIHYYLERLSTDKQTSNTALLTEAAAQHSIDLSEPRLESWLTEARKTIEAFPEFFDPDNYNESFSELPIIYEHQGKRVYGIIDKVIITTDEIILLDYKTHRGSSSDHSELAQTFKKQLAYYREGIKQLWPDKQTKCGLLFTQRNQIIWLDP